MTGLVSHGAAQFNTGGDTKPYAQSVGHPTRKSGVLGSIPGLATYFRFSFRFFKKVLVNRLGGLSLSRKNVVRLTDRPDMTLDVYRGRKTTIQYNNKRIEKLVLSPVYPLYSQTVKHVFLYMQNISL